MARRRRQGWFLVGFAAYFVLLWLLWNTPVVYPIRVFVVFLHEISHGLAALATGGSIERIELSPRLGGLCYCPGGNAFLTLSAGYLGSLLWGAAIFETGRRARRNAPKILAGVGVATVLLTLFFVRGTFGFFFGVTFGVALALAGPRLTPSIARTALLGLGLTSTLYAILDIKTDILDRPHLPSDARMLAELTSVPTLVWGIVWIGIALGVSSWLFLRAFREA